MKKILTIIIMILISTNFTFANDGSKKIKLKGKLSPSTSKRVSVKNIENDFKYYEYKVFNPYEKKEDLYGGVLLSDLIKRYGTKDVSSIKLKAIDDYEVSFLKEELDHTKVLLVTKVNKNYIGFKQKGPMRIVFPELKERENKELYKKNLPKWMWMITIIELQ